MNYSNQLSAFMFIAASILSIDASASTSTDMEQQHSLTVTVAGYPVIAGKSMVALYTSKDDFDNSREPYKGFIRHVSHDTDTFVFSELPSGQYAVKLFHDENENGYIDFAQHGAPIEAWGISSLGEKEQLLRAPQFEDADFLLNEDKEIKILLRK